MGFEISIEVQKMKRAYMCFQQYIDGRKTEFYKPREYDSTLASSFHLIRELLFLMRYKDGQ